MFIRISFAPRAHLRHALAPLLALAAVACGGDESGEGFDYGADEMRAAVVGEWAGELRLKGQEATALTLRLEHQPPGTSPACERRVFGLQPLGDKCGGDVSTLGVKGTLTTADGAYRDTPVEGSYRIHGTTLVGGSLSLRVNDGTSLDADQTDGAFPNGTVSRGTVGEGTLDLEAGAFSLHR